MNLAAKSRSRSLARFQRQFQVRAEGLVSLSPPSSSSASSGALRLHRRWTKNTPILQQRPPALLSQVLRPGVTRSYSSTMTKKQEAHQFQAGNSTHRREDEWKSREPYRIHDKDENFDVKWEGECHCGKVKYQLSRDKPLASKYCHCTTCQRLHGVSCSPSMTNPESD